MQDLLEMQLYRQLTVSAVHVQTVLCFAPHDLAERLTARTIPRKAKGNKKETAVALNFGIKTLTTVPAFD